jgi:hypothetical protein
MTTPSPQLPIVLGVSGHRDIPAGDEAILQEAVKSIFADYRKRYPDTPLIMLTGLAEGADQLVARVALEFGVEIGAVLPLQVSEYERDFVDPLTRQNFHDLLAKSHWQVVVQPETVTDPREETQRNSCYAAVGHYICRHAQMLVTLWDGHDNGKVGGTAYVVRKFRKGFHSDDVDDGLLDFPDCGPVRHIWTRRIAGPDYVPNEIATGSSRELYPIPVGLEDDSDSKKSMDDFERQRWADIFSSIQTFNRSSRDFPIDKLREASEGLVGKAIAVDQLPAAMQATAITYAVADTLSFDAQTKRRKLFQGMIGSFLAAIFFELLYSGPYPHWPLLVMAILCGGLTFILFFIALRVMRLEETYLDYRAFAEALRVQYYWQQAGIDRCVADDFLRDQRDSLEWIRQSLLNLSLPRAPVFTVSKNSEETIGNLRDICDQWVHGQRSYFLGTTHKLGKFIKVKGQEKFLILMTKGFLAMAVATLATTLVWHMTNDGERTFFAEGILQWLIVTYGLFFWLLPTTELYRRTMAYDETSRNYLSTGLIFHACENRLHDALNNVDIDLARKLLLQLGRQALKENNAWLVTHRDRPLQPPL